MERITPIYKIVTYNFPDKIFKTCHIESKSVIISSGDTHVCLPTGTVLCFPKFINVDRSKCIKALMTRSCPNDPV